MDMKTILIRKPVNYDQVLADQKTIMKNVFSKIEEYEIEAVIELSHKEFEKLKTDFISDCDFIITQNLQEKIFLVKEKGTDDYSGLIIDPQGFNYPRYVGIPMQEVDIKKCPLCSHYYTGHPAISRKDNKTEICPACGVYEALGYFGYNTEFVRFLKNLRDSAKKFNVKIIVQLPGETDIVIEPTE